MAQFQQWFDQDFTHKIEIRHCESVMFTGDDKGAVVGVHLFDDGAAYSAGGTVTGAVKRSDGGLVALTGTLSGNAASVVIPAAALAYPGPIGVHIVLTQGGSVTTVLKAIYAVDDNSGAAVDPGTIIPSVNDLITAINNAVASIPSDYSALLHTLADDFDPYTPYYAWDYVWYNGTLYRFKDDHAAGAWTGADATAAVLGDDLSDLNGAIADETVKSDLLLSNKTPIRTPALFKWADHPLVGKIYGDGKYNFYTDFDVRDMANNDNGKAKYYVDPINGSDSYNGLSREKAHATIAKALAHNDCGTIYLCAGIYQRQNAFFGVNITKSVDIIAVDEGVYITTGSWTNTSKLSGAEYIYAGTRGSKPAKIVDISVLDDHGDPYVYEEAINIAAVDTTPGSWYYGGTTLYIHTLAGSAPDGTKQIMLTNTSNVNITGDVHVYMEGVNVVGGTSAVAVSNSAASDDTRFFAKDCMFYYSETVNNDVAMFKGAALTILQNCRAVGGMKDGFNYHALNGVIPKAIEIGCKGYKNGNAEDSNDQGSTMHDAGSIIRINGEYFENYGPCIADESANTHSWNLGCVCFHSVATTDSSQNSNYFPFDDVYMWLDGCVGYGSNYNVAGDLSNLYIHVPSFSGAIKPDGAANPKYY